MRRINLAIATLALSVALPATGHADSYDYEIGISYDASRASSAYVLPVFSSPVFPEDTSRFESDSDDDEIRFAGSWYFDGVAASNGPRSRAAFVSRASAVHLGYTRGSGETVSTVRTTELAVPSFMGATERTTDRFSANLRWVWAGSGWYGLAGLSRAGSETDAEFASIDLNADTYSLGFGKYIGALTTLEFRVVRLDAEASGAVIGGNSTSTEKALALSHIGNLGQIWQYGADIAVATTDRGASDGSYNARLSLYPSRPLAFGIKIDGALQDPGDVSTNYGLFASWFPRETIELVARYGWISLDEPENTDLDQYDFGVGVNFRF